MEITGQMLKDAFKKNPLKLSHVLGEAISELGATHLSDNDVQVIIQDVLNGKDNGSPASQIIKDWFTNGM
jgi:hypothetical protein